ncbi:hypothetical protein HDV05_006018 [Chytridiales sp. JEL 0842]|nr:hypothetical protein HDV05_006018 [Chytridiales sp. JEL 0842]
MLSLNSPTSPQADGRPVSARDSKVPTNASGFDLEDQDLRLHIAITSGEVDNIVVGNFDERLDYCINGECMKDLDDILSNTKPGELGLNANVLDLLKGSGMYMNLPHKMGSKKPVVLTGNQLLEAMNLQNNDSSLTSLPGEVNMAAKKKDLSDEDLANHYMTRTGRQTTLKSHASNSNPIIHDRQVDIMARFVNKALVHKLKVTSLEAQSDSKSTSHIGEFRNIVVLFCKLNFEFDVRKSQKVMVLFLNALEKFGGTFQQYSIDDKGQTMLAVFGLPPFTHANEPVEAAKAVGSFYSELERSAIEGVAVGMSTGQILFSEIGTEYRKEAGLLGEVMNTAARLMMMTLNDAVVDETTRRKLGNVFSTESLGLQQIKGRDDALEVFRLLHNQSRNSSLNNSQKTFGYKNEKEMISLLMKQWSSGEAEKGLVIVEGPSGMEKIVKTAIISLSQGTEIRQQTPYFCTRPIINLIVEKTNVEHVAAALISRRSSNVRRSISASFSMVSFKDNMMDRMAKMLLIYGEDPLQAQLFTVAFTELHESESSNSDDLKSKLIFFKALMHRLLIKFTKTHKTVFIFDDAQWVDIATLSLLLDVADSAANAFLGLFTRPYKDNPQLDKIKSLDHGLHAQLNGFTISDVEEMIVYKLGKLGQNVKIVDTKISNAVLHRSDGSPLFIDLMAEQLYSAIGTSVKIENSCLLPKDSTVDLEGFLCQSIGSGIMMQYDRLHVGFKQILRVASVMGQLQYFNIRDICEIGKLALSPNQVVDAIQKNDTFKYITLAYGDQEDTDNTLMAAFRHISIYESLSYSERSEKNTTAAKFFEKQLNAHNRYMLLPLIKFHYSNTDDCVKFINYAEELGIYYIISCSFHEGLSVIHNLIDYVESNYEKIIDYAQKRDEKKFLSDVRVASWYGYLCTGYSELKFFNNDQFIVRIATKAINLTSLKRIPSDPKQYNVALLKAMFRVWRLWIQTKGGTREGPKLSEMEKKELAIVRRALLAVNMACMYEPSVPLELAAIVLFELLACSIISAHRNRIDWCQTLVQTSYAVSWAVPFLSEVYFQTAMKLWVPTEGMMDPIGTGMAIFIHNYRTEFDEALAKFDEYMRKNDQRGDKVGSFTAVAVHSTLRFLQGDAQYLDVLLNERLPPPAQRDLWCLYYNVFTASMIYLRGKQEAIEPIYMDYNQWFHRSPIMLNEVGDVQRHYMGILRALCLREPETAFDEFKAMGESMYAKYWTKPISLAGVDILLIFPFALFGLLRTTSSLGLCKGKETYSIIKGIIKIVNLCISKKTKLSDMVLPLYHAYAALSIGKQSKAAKRLRKEYEKRSKVLDRLQHLRALYHAYWALYGEESERDESIKEV